jgi:diguanylate cyclase (GGDEF)-like protein
VVLTIAKGGPARPARRSAGARPVTRPPLRYGSTARSSAATVIGTLYGFSASACLLAVWFPMGPGLAIGLSLFFGILGLTIAATLFVLRHRAGTVTLNAALTLATVLGTVLVARTASAAGVVLPGMFFMAIALIGAYFFPPLAARAQAGLAALGYSAGVLASGVPNLFVPWFVIVGGVLGGAEVLRHMVIQLRRQAALDPLTGLANRACFQFAAERELALAGRSHARFSVALLDLDGFKAVNDTYGHVAGDVLLAELAAAWQAQIRRGDLLARYGGDEFALIMPDTGAGEAAQVLERLRAAHHAHWSVGVATWDGDTDLNQLLRRADYDLYRAKEARRR